MLAIYKHQMNLQLCTKYKVYVLIWRSFTQWGPHILLLSMKKFSLWASEQTLQTALSNYVQSRDNSIFKGEDNGLATERLKFLNEIPYGDGKNFEWEKSLTVEHESPLPILPRDYRVSQELNSQPKSLDEPFSFVSLIYMWSVTYLWN